MKIESLKNNPKIGLNENSQIILKECGKNYKEIKYSINHRGGTIRRIDKDNYYDIRTGEVKQYNHNAKSRRDNVSSVKRTMSKIRDLIRCNITDSKKVMFITLTYKENMTDKVQLGKDIKAFYHNLKKFLKVNNLPSDFARLSITEIQRRGAYHQHELIFWHSSPTFISNEILEKEIWKKGFTKIQLLSKMDGMSICNYVMAYLTDLDITEDVEKITGQKVNKSIIKGGRLKMYPIGLKIYRCSRNLKRATIQRLTESEAMKKVNGSVLVFEKTIKISNNDGKTINIINYRKYDNVKNFKK